MAVIPPKVLDYSNREEAVAIFHDFDFPWGISSSTDNQQIFIADHTHDELRVYSCSSHAATPTETGKYPFQKPKGIAVDSLGNMIVTMQTAVQKYDAGSETWMRLDRDGQFKYPDAVTVGSDDRIYVADKDMHEIQVLSPSGEHLQTIGSHGDKPGEFNWPHGLTTTPDGDIVVADTYNSRIQVLTPSGEFKFQFGSHGSEEGEFTWPRGMVVDKDGNIVICDSCNHRLQVYSRTGEFVCSIGKYGDASGDFHFPRDVCLTTRGLLMVTDFSNHRVQLL